MSRLSAKIITYLVLFIIFIFPSGLLFGTFNSIHNHIFTVLIVSIFFADKLINHNLDQIRINIFIILFFILIIIVALITKRFGIFDLCIIPIAFDYIDQKEEVFRVLKKSKLPYICFAFTLVYSIVYMKLGYGGRGEGNVGSGMLFTAIGEINLAGLSIFCLSMILLKINKKAGCFVAICGVFTISRSYLLALLCVFVFKRKLVMRIFSRAKGIFSYFNLALVSSIFLFFLGVRFTNLYLSGLIVDHNTTAGFSRLFVLNDMSNYFRFLAIYLIVKIIISDPVKLFLGFSEKEFIQIGGSIAESEGLLFSEIGTHNLIFSHLKMYGVFAVIEIMLISKCLKKVTTASNFGIFVAIFLYCIILGTGLNSYWLYLTIIVMICHMDRGGKDERIGFYNYECL